MPRARGAAEQRASARRRRGEHASGPAVKPQPERRSVDHAASADQTTESFQLFLNQASRAVGQDHELVSNKINRTLDIINYLNNALDHDKGGDIAFNLERLYDYMRDVLAQVNIHPDTDKIQHVIGLLQTLLEGWRGIVANQTADGETPVDQQPAAPGAPPSAPTQPLNLSMVG
jgi:flagellar biosynthetic protein FliS